MAAAVVVGFGTEAGKGSRWGMAERCTMNQPLEDATGRLVIASTPAQRIGMMIDMKAGVVQCATPIVTVGVTVGVTVTIVSIDQSIVTMVVGMSMLETVGSVTAVQLSRKGMTLVATVMLFASVVLFAMTVMLFAMTVMLLATVMLFATAMFATAMFATIIVVGSTATLTVAVVHVARTTATRAVIVGMTKGVTTVTVTVMTVDRSMGRRQHRRQLTSACRGVMMDAATPLTTAGVARVLVPAWMTGIRVGTGAATAVATGSGSGVAWIGIEPELELELELELVGAMTAVAGQGFSAAAVVSRTSTNALLRMLTTIHGTSCAILAVERQ